MELIDRKKAIYYISNYMSEGGFMELSDFDIASLLLEVPTENNKLNGKWITEREYHSKQNGKVASCNKCGTKVVILTTPPNFCHNCGADMRGGE